MFSHQKIYSVDERKVEDKTRTYETRRPQETTPCDDNGLERNLKLEKVVDSEQLRLDVETEEERRARLENVAATKLLSLAVEMDK